MEPVGALKIQLESALLCLDLGCNAVFDGSLTRHCPACGGEDTYPLAVWLNRADALARRGQVIGGDRRERVTPVLAGASRAA